MTAPEVFGKSLDKVNWEGITYNPEMTPEVFGKSLDKVSWEGITSNTCPAPEVFGKSLDKVNWEGITSNTCPICTEHPNLEYIENLEDVKVTSLYNNIEFLDSGGSSCVYQCKRKSDGKLVVLKIIKPNYYEKHVKNLLYVEIMTQRYLQTKNFLKDHIPQIYNVRYLNADIDKQPGNKLTIEMDFISGKPLKKFINKKLSEEVIIDIFRQVLILIKE